MTQKLHEVLAGHHDVLINDEVAVTAAELLKSRPASVPEPMIVPVFGGGLMLGWQHVNGRDAVIATHGDGAGGAYWAFESWMAMDGSVSADESTWVRSEQFPQCDDVWDRIASIFGEIASTPADIAVDRDGRVTGNAIAMLAIAAEWQPLSRSDCLEVVRDGFVIDASEVEDLVRMATERGYIVERK